MKSGRKGSNVKLHSDSENLRGPKPMNFIINGVPSTDPCGQSRPSCNVKISYIHSITLVAKIICIFCTDALVEGHKWLLGQGLPTHAIKSRAIKQVDILTVVHASSIQQW